ncbi:MAG: S1 family peptidase, partial [Gemmatimonadales bacterium]
MRALNRLFPRPLLALLLLALPLAAEPSHGQTQNTVLSQPDPRAILPLVGRSGNLLQYGTGVVVGRDTIVTADHVLSQSVRVLLPAGTREGKPSCRTQITGLAVVKAPLPPRTPQYRLSFREPSVGEAVTIAGYPLRKWQVSTGRITHLLNSATISGRIVAAPMMAIDPALDYGASGSPVLDGTGMV